MDTDLRSTVIHVLRSILALVSSVFLGAGGLLLGALLFTATIFLAGVESPAVVIVLSLVFVQGVGCIGVALTYIRLRPVVTSVIGDVLGYPEYVRDFSVDATVPDFEGWAIIVAGYVVALGSAFAGATIVSQFQVETGQNAAAEIGMENPEVLLLLIPASILLIGPGEELLFRGIVQGRLREVFSPISAILVASFVFAMLHWFALSGGSPTGNLVAAGLLIGPAIVLGTAYEYTDNIVVPSLIHGIYNATLFTLLYVVIAFSDVLDEAAPQMLVVLA
ncbi:hypothetical protein SAMN05216559_2988 [Halomicrobium zhouii]|uniref:CAAX prenyl protease 2/Lysostaphin resistance protein A-like domain-containing protein n=1 Tax=Halomicrobium zhouii TaxID=767519 RepID=A0A1I6LSF1_9EURY|nr:CPBP family intramembrane glutamic endopeptidase [Halomicrobium zhouii]SFS06182.1 hypothetical protein SAMN05216559_2988 [Halomicrobium zhouii]